MERGVDDARLHAFGDPGDEDGVPGPTRDRHLRSVGDSPLLGWEINGVYTPVQAPITLPSASVKTTVQVGEVVTFQAVYQPTKTVPPVLTPPPSNPAPSNGGKASIGG